MPHFSGTIAQTVFPTRKVLDRAFGRIKVPPEEISGEYLDIARDLLYLTLSTYASKGIALWAVQKLILPLYEAVQTVPAPAGVVDVLNANLRTVTRLQGTNTASSGIVANAFDGDLQTACVQSAPGGHITVAFSALTRPIIFGLVPQAFGLWGISIQTSLDGITWADVYVNPELAVQPDQWFWVDIEGIPQAGVNFVRLQADSETTLDVAEFVIADNPQEIPLAKINRDDYANLPDKWSLGRPVQFWYDKQIDQPLLTIWPSPQPQFTFAQLVLYVQNYIQDVGSLSQSLAIPQRWFLAIIADLSRLLNAEIPKAQGDPNMLAIEAERLIAQAWASETDSSPTYLRPRLWSYTR